MTQLNHKNRTKWTFQKSLVASIFIHAFWMLLVVFTPKDFFKIKAKEIVQIEFVEPEKKSVPKIIPPKVEKHQVVEQDEKAANDEVPEDAKFLSAKNQVIKKQTVAVERGEFKNSKSKDKNPGKENEVFKPLTISDLKPKFDIAKTIQQKITDEQLREKTAEENAVPQKPLTQQQKPANSGGSDVSRSIDYIKDLDPGLETMLSTKEFVYYTYYARIRRQLNQHWGPKVKDSIAKIYKQGRSIASSDDKVTKLLVTLDKEGRLVKVQVIGDSGIRDLDEAAVEAFRAAAPFPNPPNGIIDPDGMIMIRWDFILEA